MTEAANTPMLQPTFTVSIDGKDVTGRLKPCISSMTITTCRQDHADQLDLEFEDTDGRIALPSTGVMAEVMLGFEGSGVSLQGTFTVDEVEHRGAPDMVSVRGRSAPVATTMATRRERSWSNTTIGHVINIIAGENNLTPRVPASLASKPVTQIDQTESDLALLQRLGKLWDAVATVKHRFLVFQPIGKAQTTSGKDLPTLTITRRSGDEHRFHTAKRTAYTGVRARWHDMAKARGRTALAGKNGHVKIIRGDYASEEDAKRAAEAEFARIQRGASTFEVTLAVGRPDAYPEMPVKLQGWPKEIEAIEWIVSRATHRLTGSNGYTTVLELENKAAADDHAAVSEDSDDAGDESQGDSA